MPMGSQPPRRAPRPVDTPPEEEESGFEASFAPVPPAVAAVSETVERSEVPPAAVEQVPQRPLAPPINYASPIYPKPDRPTEYVKILSQVGSFKIGSVVPVAAFPELERLLSIRPDPPVEFTYEQPSLETIDETLATGMRLAQPVRRGGHVQRAPTAQATIRDVIGGAGRRPAPRVVHTQAPPVPYSVVQGEFGPLVVADQTPKQQPPSTPVVLSPEQINDDIPS
jgi:hypothetical protein